MDERKQTKHEKRGTPTRRIALMGVFVAMAFAVSFWEFPIFPAVDFLMLDFSNVFILLTGFILGPIEGVLVCILKELFRALFYNKSGGIGEIANVLVTSWYILLPSILYQWKKSFKVVIPSLLGGCILGSCMALITNRFLTFPLYMGSAGVAFFMENVWWILAFNMIKTVSVSLVVLLLYKRLSNVLKSLKI